MEQNSNVSLRRFMLSLILLLGGTAIYIMFRQDSLFLSWIDNDVLNKLYIALPDSLSIKNNMILYWIMYCLPDALWYSALLILQFPFLKLGGWHRFISIASILLPFCLEILQYYKIIRGTFDLFDIATYILTLILVIVFYQKNICIKSLHRSFNRNTRHKIQIW